MLGQWETVTLDNDVVVKQEEAEQNGNAEENAPKRRKKGDESWNWVLEDEQVTSTTANGEVSGGKSVPKTLFHCDLCDLPFPDKFGLEVHKSITHKTREESLFEKVKSLEEKERALRDREMRLKEMKMSLMEKELEEKERALQERERRLKEMEMSLVEKEKSLQLQVYSKEVGPHCKVCSTSHPEQPCVCLRCNAHYECRQAYQLHEKGCTRIYLKCCVCLEFFEEMPMMLAHLKSGLHTKQELEKARILGKYPFFEEGKTDKCDVCNGNFPNLEWHIQETHKEVLRQPVAVPINNPIRANESQSRNFHKDMSGAKGPTREAKAPRLRPASPGDVGEPPNRSSATDESHKSATFKCSECRHLFDTASQHSLRLKKVFASEFPCSTCSFVGKSTEELEKHTVFCIFKCYQCEEEKDPSICLRCYRDFESRKEYQLHEKVCTKPWKCGVCMVSFDNIAVLLVHLKGATHGRYALELVRIWGRYPFFEKLVPSRCDICEMSVEDLKKHINCAHNEALIHSPSSVSTNQTSEQLQCHICNMNFTDRYFHKFHMTRIHTLFKCLATGCTELFNSEDELTLHHQIHAKMAPTRKTTSHEAGPSRTTSKKVSTNASLPPSHIKCSNSKLCQLRHPEPNICLRCHEEFECRYEYNLHVSKCTLPWQCAVCKANFKCDRVLLVHLKSSTHLRSELEKARIWGRFPFLVKNSAPRCDICWKPFQNLQAHISSFHKSAMHQGTASDEPEKPAGCDKCGEAPHTEPCICLRCHALFDCSQEYQRHDEKCSVPLACLVCKVPFENMALLLVHLKSGAHMRSQLERARMWGRYPLFKKGAFSTWCDICERDFVSIKSHILCSHKQESLKKKPKPQQAANIPEKVAVQPEKLPTPPKEPEKSKKCHKCLGNHLEKVYQCQRCEGNFECQKECTLHEKWCSPVDAVVVGIKEELEMVLD